MAAADEAPLIQRLGLAYLQRRERALSPTEADDAIHVLDEAEQEALRDIERRMVMRAVVAGALSGLAAALAEIAAAPLQRADGSLLDNAAYWGVVGGVTIFATVLEIAFLYWDSLRSVHDLARAAGVPLFAGGSVGGGFSPLATTLARAALEMPSPTENEFNVNPYRRVSKLRLALAGLIYKLKITLTSFLIKALLRRALGRAALRVWLVFVGVPVCAAWNGIVAWLIVREARLRAIGASAAHVYMDQLFAGRAAPSKPAQRALWLALGSCVVCSRDLHPNLLSLLHEMQRRFDLPGEEAIDDSDALLALLPTLAADERQLVLQLLCIAAVLDGRLGREERTLLQQAHDTAGWVLDLAAVRVLRRTFVGGHALTPGLLSATSAAA